MRLHFTIPDDDGLIAIVNSSRYKTFVSRDWELGQLQQHFVDEMNNQNLIIWQTNIDGGGVWNVEIINTPTDNLAFRQFSKSIEVTSGELHLTTYSDLTYAAQFEDEEIPAKGKDHLKVKLDNGLYEVMIKQLFDPADYDSFYSSRIAFEISLTPIGHEKITRVQKVFWW